MLCNFKIVIIIIEKLHVVLQGSKFHSSDHLRWVKMTVWQVEYQADLSNGRLHISDFHISCIGFIYFRQVNGSFGQVIFTIHLPDGQVLSIWNFEACTLLSMCSYMYIQPFTCFGPLQPRIFSHRPHTQQISHPDKHNITQCTSHISCQSDEGTKACFRKCYSGKAKW